MVLNGQRNHFVDVIEIGAEKGNKEAAHRVFHNLFDVRGQFVIRGSVTSMGGINRLAQQNQGRVFRDFGNRIHIMEIIRIGVIFHHEVRGENDVAKARFDANAA